MLFSIGTSQTSKHVGIMWKRNILEVSGYITYKFKAYYHFFLKFISKIIFFLRFSVIDIKRSNMCIPTTIDQNERKKCRRR